jgi:hypothetical protein
MSITVFWDEMPSIWYTATTLIAITVQNHKHVTDHEVNSDAVTAAVKQKMK